MGTSGRTTDADEPGADNVIRFPRAWFGDRADLVPFGPAADRREAEQAAQQAAQARADTHPDPDDLGALLSPGDFWGGGSEALHQPVEALHPPVQVSAEALDAETDGRTQRPVNPGGRDADADEFGPRARGRVRHERLAAFVEFLLAELRWRVSVVRDRRPGRGGRRIVTRRLALGAAGALVLTLGVVSVIGRFDARPVAERSASVHAAVHETAAKSPMVAPISSVGSPTRASGRGPDSVPHPGGNAGLARLRTVGARAAAIRAAAKRTRDSAAGRGAATAHPAAPPPSSTTHRSASDGSAAAASSRPREDGSAGTTPAVSSSDVGTASQSAPVKTPAATSSASSSGAAGLGGVVGSSCDPQCGN